jgi:arsenite methyltransferase
VADQRVGAQAIKAAVRKRYASAIERPGGSCCGPAPTAPLPREGSCCGPAADAPVQIGGGCCAPPAAAMKGGMAKVAGYTTEELAQLPADAVQNSFGCGNPLAFAGVQAGQTVLDIGSGAGIDCFIAAEKVGPGGKVIGLDMTPEMIARARANAVAAGVTNAEFRLGEAERMPVDDESVDWIISNCVINLSPDKPAVFREIARVLRPGGRIAISDIVAQDLPAALRESQDAWTGCLAGAISEAEYLRGLEAAGLTDVRVGARIVYEASQLKGLFASSCCGLSGGSGLDPGVLAEAAAGKIWSARFGGRKPSSPAAGPVIAIERAADRDVAGIKSLLAEAGLPTDMDAHIGGFLVARDGERIVGCVGMEVGGKDALFRSLAVAGEARGAGLGRRLCEALVTEAKARGVERAYLLTATIVPLAERWGFVRIDREAAPSAIRATAQFSDRCCAKAMVMRRDLRGQPTPACGCT